MHFFLKTLFLFVLWFYSRFHFISFIRFKIIWSTVYKYKVGLAITNLSLQLHFHPDFHVIASRVFHSTGINWVTLHMMKSLTKHSSCRGTQIIPKCKQMNYDYDQQVKRIINYAMHIIWLWSGTKGSRTLWIFSNVLLLLLENFMLPWFIRKMCFFIGFGQTFEM